jgi:hypothetical protein
MSGKRAPWRTPEREVILRRDWPAGIRRDVMHARMLEEEGPAFPAHYIGVWADQLRLSRPGGFRKALVAVAHAASVRATRERMAARAAARAERAGLPAPPPVDEEAAPVPLLPRGVMRQTPSLRTGLELLDMGVPPAVIRDRVKLTATEFAKIREAHAERGA